VCREEGIHPNGTDGFCNGQLLKSKKTWEAGARGQANPIAFYMNRIVNVAVEGQDQVKTPLELNPNREVKQLFT
jgi:hypothetical protein